MTDKELDELEAQLTRKLRQMTVMADEAADMARRLIAAEQGRRGLAPVIELLNCSNHSRATGWPGWSRI